MGPLRDLRVVELAGLGATPFCAMLLADLGADVIRIDRPDAVGAESFPSEPSLLRGRPSAAVDLKHPDGPELVLRLVEQADALVEGYRPGVAERLGVGPDACFARNERLVYGRMTGWGQTGPYASLPGHDLNYIAVSGALAAIGRPPLNLVGDFGGGGLLLAFGIVSAVLEAKSSGRGQVVDAAMSDGAALLMTMIYGLRNAGLWIDETGANLLDGGAPFYDVYETADGQRIAIGCLEPKFYAELARLLEVELPENHFNRDTWPVIRETLTHAIGSRTRAECERLFAGSETCFAPVLGLAEAPEHEHNRARGTFYASESGPLPAPSPRFARTPPAQPEPSSSAGADTLTALARWGLDETEIDSYCASGAAVQA
jgi:alpha-methylacyl-CoA racemase